MCIDVKNISYTYLKNSEFEHKALQNIGITIKQGDFLGIMGTTGSGKTTFLHCLAGLITPDTGSIEYAQIKAKTGFIFQYPEHQLFASTVFADIAFGLKKYKLPPEQVKKKVYAAMRQVNLDPEIFSERFPYSLSGGEKRKAAIAGVLVSEPDILLLDEPASGLDSASRKSIFDCIKNIHKKGKTIVMISHDPDCLAEYCSRIAVFKNGHIVKCGTPQSILSDTALLKASGVETSVPAKIVQACAEKGIQLKPHIGYKSLLDEVVLQIQKKGGGQCTA